MEKNQTKSVFETLNGINVNEHTEILKQGNAYLTYLSWAWAWAEVKKHYPDAGYTIYKDEQKRPYIEDPDYGLMCYTTVTINGQTHEMWLPVLDGANKAMRRTPYKYQTKSGERTCEAATMFDINKTIMRCLVKNLAMFGLGLYIYAGEDLPEEAVTEKKKAADDELQKAIDEMKATTSLEAAQKAWDAHKSLQPNAKYLAATQAMIAKFKNPQPQTAAQPQQAKQ